MNFKKLGLVLGGVALAVSASAFGGQAHFAFADHGDIAKGATINIEADATVSGDIQLADGSVKFYDGHNPTVVFFAQMAQITAPWGASWVSMDETDPQTVAANNNARLQVWPAGASVPQTVGTLLSNPPSRLVSQPAAPAQSVNTTAAATSGGCPAIAPGGPVPFEFITTSGTACSMAPQLPITGTPYGQDIVLAASTQPQAVPAGYFCDGDISIPGAKYYMGGDQGAKTVVIVAMTLDHSDILAPWGADCQPGGVPEMERECSAKLAEPGTAKSDCTLFADP